MTKAVIKKLKIAYDKDSEICCERAQMGETLGSNPEWLKVLGLEKSDLIRLERMGYAFKARYLVEKTGEHRVRWIIFTEALNDYSL